MVSNRTSHFHQKRSLRKRRDAPGIEYLEAASLRVFGMSIGRANDDPRSSHADMLRCLDVAIAMAAAAATEKLRDSSAA
jgi:hypothetical protein